MADYYDALKGAVINLKTADRRSRQAFYERARGLMLERLQAAEPPMAADEVRAEMTAFDAAIRQIETDLLPPVHPAPHAPPTPHAQPVPHAQPAPPAPQAPRAPQSTSSQKPDRAPSSRRPVRAPPPVQADLAMHQAAPSKMAVAEEPLVQAGTLPVRTLVIGAVAIAALVAAYALWPGAAPAPRADRAPPVAPKSDTMPPAKTEPAPASNAENLPYILRRQLVFYRTVQTPGTIVISKSQHFLYVVRPNSSAMRYTFAAGPDCLDLSGLYPVSRKDGGADTALGLGDEKCRIRPTDTPNVIGQNTRVPGFQLAREDFADLFEHTGVDTRVVVAN